MSGSSRTSGALTALAGVVMVGGGVAVMLGMATTNEARDGSVLGFPLLLVGLLVVMMGVGQMSRTQYVREELWEVLPPAKLLDRIKNRPQPFFVCTTCSIVIEPDQTMGPCPRCDSGVDCYPVDNPDALQMVISLVAD